MRRRNKIKTTGAIALKMSRWISDLNYFLDTKAGIAFLIICACIPEMISTNNLFKEFFNQRGTNHAIVSMCVVGVVYFGGSYYLAVAGSKVNSIIFTVAGVCLAAFGWYLTLADEYIQLTNVSATNIQMTKFYIKVSSITLFVITNGYLIGILCDKMCERSQTDVQHRATEEGNLNIALSSVRKQNALSYTNLLKGKSTALGITEEEAEINTKQQIGNRKSTGSQHKPTGSQHGLTERENRSIEQQLKELGL